MKEIFKLMYDSAKKSFSVEGNVWFLLAIILIIAIPYLVKLKKWSKKAELVEVEVEFGSNGIKERCKYKIERNSENIYIANRIYVELITRKAVIEVDPEFDVIDDVYNSWYKLFTIIREEIKNIPGKYLEKKDTSTDQLLQLTVKILNDGLRPHLTKYQAEFRNWYKGAMEKQGNNSPPQAVQKQYYKFGELVDDMKKVNQLLHEYSEQLKAIVYDGKK